MRSHHLVAASVACLLSACSGSDGRPNNSPPSLTNAKYTEVRENRKGVFFSLASVDQDGDTISYSLGGVDAQWFSVDAQSGDLQLIQPADFEAPRDENGDNHYQLLTVAKDSRGAQTTQALTVQVVNVEFDYEILSPLPNTILELERYSRLPLAVWMEYDYPERLQIIANGEILNKASDSGASWTGSISMENGNDVEMLFWRGDELLDKRTIPVRHQHVISSARNLVYDAVNDQIIIPHEQRLEILIIDPSTGQSTKDYPWVKPIPNISDIAFDSVAGSAIYAAGAIGRLDILQGDATPLKHNLDSTFSAWGLAHDALHNELFFSSGQSGTRYVRLNLDDDVAQEFEYASKLVQDAQPAYLAHDVMNGRLFVAPGNAAGVEVVDVASNTWLKAFPADWPAGDITRIGKIAYDATRDALFMASPDSDSIIKLDTSGGQFSVASGNDFVATTARDIGGGSPLKAPDALALDHQRDRLLTISASRLLAVDPDTGDREVVFDSAAGAGALSSGFAASWVARDGSRALAMDNAFGRFFDINLRTGVKTAKTYSTGASSPSAFVVTDAKISSDGHYAVVHVRERAGGTGSSVKLVNLQDGASRILLHLSDEYPFVDFNFSWPDNKLILALRTGDGETELHILSVAEAGSAEVFAQHRLPATSNETLAVHLVHDQIYLLERVSSSDAQQTFYQLSVLDPSYERTTVLHIQSLAATRSTDAGLNAMADGALLVILLPDQSPRFWNIAEATEAPIESVSFRGSDQPKDFYTVDDFRELLYFRASAGLHICWRSNCAILAN